ncbi:hypothetical protein MTR67_042193 [Solanum verrucosum]|uniref:Uncharacterized protein n=1 Tax=Solanum verrucosum TaxID=315347 RepID=A0AAF0UNT6_SOLVR|nr:hypothetical protein MTR67_042193 [Solanum verrucosum]
MKRRQGRPGNKLPLCQVSSNFPYNVNEEQSAFLSSDKFSKPRVKVPILQTLMLLLRDGSVKVEGCIQKKMEGGNKVAAADLGGSVLTGTLGNPLGLLE